MNIYFKGIRYKIHDYMFYISYKNVFLNKTQIAKSAYSASVTARMGADYASRVRSPRHADVLYCINN